MENEVATKKDLQILKEDLRKELDKFLTKEDFKKELKEELSRFTTKEEFRFEISLLRKEMREMDEKHDQRYDKILEILDGIAGQLANNRLEKAASEATFQLHESRLEDHEVRIQRLETA